MMASFQVEEDGALPRGLCRDCAENALAAVNFRHACKQAFHQWAEAAAFLASIIQPQPKDKAFYIFYSREEKTIIGDQAERASDKKNALKRLNTRFEEVTNEVVDDKEKKLRRLNKMSWSCPDCGKKFISPQYLNSHLKNSLKRACEECGLVMSKSKLAVHLSEHHRKMVFSCGVCQQVYDRPNLLEAHFEATHGDEAHHCKVCGGGFSNERALGAHSYVHSLFLCNECGRCFDNKKCYLHHQKQCKKANFKIAPRSCEYICDYCGNSYTKKPSLRVHMIQKHLNVLPHVCATCGKRTSTIAHLRSHEKVHLLERKTFQCYCGAKMRTALGYQLHMRIHSGEKPYECEECGDKFLSASRRLDHVKRRHRSAKEMAHGCKECPARFVRPFELRKHYMSVHSHVPLAGELRTSLQMIRDK